MDRVQRWLLVRFPRPVVVGLLAVLTIAGLLAALVGFVGLMLVCVLAVWLIGEITGWGINGVAVVSLLIVFIGLAAAYYHSTLPRREKKPE